MYNLLWYIAAIVDLSPLPRTGTEGDDSPIKVLFNIFLAVMGALAVLIITVAGLRLTLSNGDPQSISRAKDTIIYSLVGLVVILFSAAIVNFVFGNL